VPKQARVADFCPNPERRWKPRTPAMAAGLAHTWTAKELLTTVAPP